MCVRIAASSSRKIKKRSIAQVSIDVFCHAKFTSQHKCYCYWFKSVAHFSCLAIKMLHFIKYVAVCGGGNIGVREKFFN